MSLILTSSDAIELTERLIAIYVLVDSAGKIYNYKEFRGNGLFSWETLSVSRFFSVRLRMFSGLLSVIFAFPGWMTLLTLRGAAALYLLLQPQDGWPATLALLLVFIIGSFSNLQQRPLGVDTESRFAVVITGALLLRSLEPTMPVTIICLWFIALQSCLSYFTAGAAKLFSSAWRSGYGLLYVLNTPGIIYPGMITRFFNRRPFLSKLLTFATILAECIFPLILFSKPPILWILLLWGVFFHLMNAVWLRLGKFFWVWIATYPAIIFIAQR